MKIEINIYDDTGERVVGKAIETDCQSLIINGMHVIQGGGVHAELRQLAEESDVISSHFMPTNGELN
tara:strand:- start:199 stop:399 length:201 start_codon:yes stop_codon:yes gene_type:complete